MGTPPDRAAARKVAQAAQTSLINPNVGSQSARNPEFPSMAISREWTCVSDFGRWMCAINSLRTNSFLWMKIRHIASAHIILRWKRPVTGTMNCTQFQGVDSSSWVIFKLHRCWMIAKVVIVGQCEEGPPAGAMHHNTQAGHLFLEGKFLNHPLLYHCRCPGPVTQAQKGFELGPNVRVNQ
ncbi:uncharacterized protein LACBIDRAFT_328289 [Laccaria bicolor S238N-H82]|uniref:Predicted protein n=1 Tax=Laccaria bicolor (strain S238N-H82 / ATCC MYA-4686) TaxID=486041 RepID=B0DEF2_LACBS|nr:uncharacterized protein LACBIDRAFT_328289 [Laccaria bicolor S238N-H82]EDR07023.1 predicted protein [Laccaria bicolor S238N-H82]|eukprot:XP_001882396.1 predicted protein [Laccaria bicolor S238N-H82]